MIQYGKDEYSYLVASSPCFDLMAFIHRAGLLPLLFILIFCTCGRAQIVNFEDKRKALDSLGWYGQVDVNGSLTRNNNTVVTAGGALRLDRLGQKATSFSWPTTGWYR